MASDAIIYLEAKRPDGTVLWRCLLDPSRIDDIMQVISQHHFSPPGCKIQGSYQIIIDMPDGL
jgi:hypothetical protein